MSAISGTLYVNQGCRSYMPKALIRAYNLDVQVKSVFDPEYIAQFPLKRAPTFVGKNGLVLTETIAITYYFLSYLDTDLLGKSKEDYAEILRWVSFSNTEVIGALSGAFGPLLGRVPYNKKVVDTNLELADVIVGIFEKRLLTHTFLVGERLTLADYFAATIIARGYLFLWGKEWRAKHVALTRWFTTVTKQPLLAWFYENFEFRDEIIKFVPPPKEAKAKADKPKADKPKAEKKAAEPEEPVDDTPKEKKAAHPLSKLPAPKMVLDEWKRTYSNTKKIREEAMPWLWEHFDPSEYSLWRVDFKYNDELTLMFMSNNLIGGFFNRLSGSIKYMFGCSVVCGENNNNFITGAFLVRGDDFKPAFDVAPDWESYTYTKLDASKEEDREFVNSIFAFDKPVTVQGELREIDDGKVLK